VSPFVDRMSLDFARAAIAGEQLGQDDAPDILSVSLSGHDYVNHAYSAESRQSHDHLLQLDRKLNVPRLVAFNSASALVTVASAMRDLLSAGPSMAAACTRQELASGSRADAPLFTVMERGWHPEISGDVQYALKPGWMSGTATATHGSPNRDDSHVPVLFYGPAWVTPGRVDTPVEVVDIASTLSMLLGIAVPASSEGKPLPLPAR